MLPGSGEAGPHESDSVEVSDDGSGSCALATVMRTSRYRGRHRTARSCEAAGQRGPANPMTTSHNAPPKTEGAGSPETWTTKGISRSAPLLRRLEDRHALHVMRGGHKSLVEREPVPCRISSAASLRMDLRVRRSGNTGSATHIRFNQRQAAHPAERGTPMTFPAVSWARRCPTRSATSSRSNEQH